VAGSIFLKSMETAVGEADVSVPIEFVRSGSLSGAVTIQYGVVGDSATAGLDFNAVGGTVVMPDGASSVTIQIPILDDDLPEATEVLSVAIISVTGAELAAPRTHRISILDDETPAPPPPAEPPLVASHDVTLAPVFDGLSTPTRFSFLPGNPSYVLVAEKAGVVRGVNIATGEVNTLLDIRDIVNNVVDRGLMDVVTHPNFAATPYVYLAYAVDPPETASRTGAAGRDGGGNRYAQVVRYTMDTSGPVPTIDRASAVVLVGAAGQSLSDISGGGAENFTDPAFADRLASDRIADAGDRVVGGFKQDYIKVDSMSHAGGRLLFGPDGMLYVSTGDGTSFNYADPRSSHVQSLDSLSGKILRIDPITGLGLPDNPYAGGAERLSDNRAKVWQYGLRNPFSAAFDAEGRLFIADVGWSTYEELNNAGPGANFGWPYFEGADGGVLLRTPDYRDQPGADGVYSAVEAGTLEITPAFRAFGHAAEVPGFRMQAIIMGALIPDNGRYPESLAGHLLFSDYLGGNLFSVNTNNRVDIGFLFDWPGERGPIHMQVGPDGIIHYIDLNTGELGRLTIADTPAGGSARLTIAPKEAAVLEGTGGTTPYAFTVTRTGVMGTAFSIGWNVAPGFEIGTSPAQAEDFAGGVFPTGTVSFAAGQATATITVTLAADDANEPNERFDVVLAAPPSRSPWPMPAASSSTTTTASPPSRSRPTRAPPAKAPAPPPPTPSPSPAPAGWTSPPPSSGGPPARRAPAQSRSTPRILPAAHSRPAPSPSPPASPRPRSRWPSPATACPNSMSSSASRSPTPPRTPPSARPPPPPWF
jgi:glucose/arabinose dehydrogenase